MASIPNKTQGYEVYKLTSPDTTMVYYGSTENGLNYRMQDHVSSLKHNRHFNRRLQSLYNGGITNWSIVFIQTAVDKVAAHDVERELIIADPKAMNVIYQPGRAKAKQIVTDFHIEQIFALKQQGMKQYDICNVVGLSACSVSYIARNEGWLHTGGLRLQKISKGKFTTFIETEGVHADAPVEVIDENVLVTE